MSINLDGKSSKDILGLLKEKYPNPPKYIDAEQFIPTDEMKNNNVLINTDDWLLYYDPSYRVGIRTKPENLVVYNKLNMLNEDNIIKKLLNNSNQLVVTTKVDSSLGGRRRRQRQTKVKSKKRANKRRTRSRK